MTDTAIALQNAVAATITSGPFFQDLAGAVSNDHNADTGARWLWTILAERGAVFAAYDNYVGTIEAIDRVWPIMRMAAEMFDSDPSPIARFVAERIQGAVKDTTEVPLWGAPVTAAVVLADRAHDIAAFFSIGLKPNGSKDPYAIRRAAKHFIIAARLATAKEAS